MGFLDALQASASGLSAQRVRMRLIANNLANMHTTRTPEGGPYQRREPIFAAESPDNATFHDMLKAQQEGGVVEVRTVDIIKDGRDPIRKYEPDHPDADETGFISLPNISVTEEMVNAWLDEHGDDHALPLVPVGMPQIGADPGQAAHAHAQL